MSNKRLLVVEDDHNISKLVCYNLDKAGYSCRAVYSGTEAVLELSNNKYDLVILDIMLPGINGLDVCRKIKSDKRTKDIKVVMLTAKGEEVDRIVGFELGADDYIVKPFSPRELVLRIQAVLRRGTEGHLGDKLLSYKELKVDAEKHVVSIADKKIDLTAMEFRLLSILLKNIDRVQTRDLLLEDVWGISSDVTTRTVDTHIKRLRQKMGNYGKYIVTVRGIGYKFSQDGVD